MPFQKGEEAENPKLLKLDTQVLDFFFNDSKFKSLFFTSLELQKFIFIREVHNLATTYHLDSTLFYL